MLWKEVGALKYREGVSQLTFGKTPNELRVPFESVEDISGKGNAFPKCPNAGREKKWYVLLTARRPAQLEQSRQRRDEVRKMLGVMAKSMSRLINAVQNYWRLTQS